ncbi:MAG: elongation factor P [Tenericutes bacterium]|nr:elongation factor P [Mycoplasmatota bacterium]
MITTADFRNGMNIVLNKQLFNIVWFQHHKPGKGGAIVRVKLKNIKTGQILERTFRAGEKVEDARLESKKKTFLYATRDEYNFMDMETYEQFVLTKEQLKDKVNFLIENMEVSVLWYNGEVIGIELPITVDLKVVYTEPGLKGNTASSTTKPATLETELVIQVPLFVNIDDVVRVDTRNGEYLQRV